MREAKENKIEGGVNWVSVTNYLEVQIKATGRYHLTPVNMAIIKNQKVHVGENGEVGTLVHCRWECKMVLSLQTTV